MLERSRERIMSHPFLPVSSDSIGDGRTILGNGSVVGSGLQPLPTSDSCSLVARNKRLEAGTACASSHAIVPYHSDELLPACVNFGAMTTVTRSNVIHAPIALY